MPPKRKALSSTTGNATRDSKSRVSKATKTRKGQCASSTRAGEFKYSSANSLKNKPTYLNLEWPNIARFLHDPSCQDKPAPNQLVDEYCHRVSDLGIPLSKDGAEMLRKFQEECDKRNQDFEGLHIWSDWNGWGISEVMENFLKDLNRDLEKKSVSPYRKWAYVETFACFVMSSGDLFLDNDDADSINEILDTQGLMIFTCFSVLGEHDLFNPNNEIKNIEICILIILEFLVKDCVDYGIEWTCEIVRKCDEAGFHLDAFVRKQVCFGKKDLGELRKEYRNREVPEEKDLKEEYKTFRAEHRGGSVYDLTKMSKEEKRLYSLDEGLHIWPIAIPA